DELRADELGAIGGRRAAHHGAGATLDAGLPAGHRRRTGRGRYERIIAALRSHIVAQVLMVCGTSVCLLPLRAPKRLFRFRPKPAGGWSLQSTRRTSAFGAGAAARGP